MRSAPSETSRRAAPSRASSPGPSEYTRPPYRRAPASRPAAARDLEPRVARAVLGLGQAQEPRRGQVPGQRVLRQQPDRRVDEARHGYARDRYRPSRVSTLMRSPSLTKSGTWTTAPVSTVA